MKSPILLTLALLLAALAPAQILDVTPIFPRDTDVVTIIYNAKEGNGALAGFVPVYAHTGVITDQSAHANDWRHVQGNWGTADPNVQMTPLGNDRHQIQYHVRNFYNVPMNETITHMAFVFRTADGSVVGRDFDGSDIFYPVLRLLACFTTFVTPAQQPVIVNIGDSIDVYAAASDSAGLHAYG